jgi:Fe-S oxidoreductase
MGLVHWWARVAARAPGLANTIAQSPFTAPLFKRLGGVALERRIPMFATRTFKQIWRHRPPRNSDGQPIVLWPDTFNDHFFPETALAAAEVLEALGFRVVVPEGDVCCGRPLYDFGMLTTAKRLLKKDLRALQSEIAAGTPVVGLEPSCVSIFHDEMTNLLPHDRDAQRLRSQTFLFAEFLGRHADPERLAKLSRKAVVHGHCHHKALFGLEDEQQLLQRLGLDVEVLETGCCGMAGSFGFEHGEKYRLSQQIGELDVLPKVRSADPEALLVSDGFSCREQIRAGTPRRAIHVAQVARMAMDAATIPTRSVALLDARRPAGVAVLALAGLGAGALLRARPRPRRLTHPLRGTWLRVALVIAASAALALTGLAASVPRDPEEAP